MAELKPITNKCNVDEVKRIREEMVDRMEATRELTAIRMGEDNSELFDEGVSTSDALIDAAFYCPECDRLLDPEVPAEEESIPEVKDASMCVDCGVDHFAGGV